MCRPRRRHPGRGHRRAVDQDARSWRGHRKALQRARLSAVPDQRQRQGGGAGSTPTRWTSAKLRFAPEDLALLKTLRSQAGTCVIRLRKPCEPHPQLQRARRHAAAPGRPSRTWTRAGAWAGNPRSRRQRPSNASGNSSALRLRELLPARLVVVQHRTRRLWCRPGHGGSSISGPDRPAEAQPGASARVAAALLATTGTGRPSC